jgi:hypothetical protein
VIAGVGQTQIHAGSLTFRRYVMCYCLIFFIAINMTIVPLIVSTYTCISGFGGLVVSMLVPKIAGSNPAEAVGFFRA